VFLDFKEVHWQVIWQPWIVDTWRQLGRIHEKYCTKKLPMVPPTIGSYHPVKHSVKHLQVPKNKSKHVWQLTTSFYESTLCQEHLQVPKNRCKREENSQDLVKGSRKDDLQVPKKPSFLELLIWVIFFGNFTNDREIRKSHPVLTLSLSLFSPPYPLLWMRSAK
jgi:hypothetical protein